MEAIGKSLDWAQIIAKLAAGGPAYWIAGGVGLILVIIIYLKIKAWMREQADQATQAKKEHDQAATLPVNQQATSDWDKASQEVQDIHEQAKKDFPPQQQ